MTTNESSTPDEIIALDFTQLGPEAHGRASGLMTAISGLSFVREEIQRTANELKAQAADTPLAAIGMDLSKFAPVEAVYGIVTVLQEHLTAELLKAAGKELLKAAGKELPEGARARAYAFPTDTTGNDT